MKRPVAGQEGLFDVVLRPRAEATPPSIVEIVPRWFDGATYDPTADYERLKGQTRSVFGVMADGRWHTLAEVAAMVRAPEASVSARLRDLRKPRYGAFAVDRRRVEPGAGLYEYRLALEAERSA